MLGLWQLGVQGRARGDGLPRGGGASGPSLRGVCSYFWDRCHAACAMFLFRLISFMNLIEVVT